MQLKDATRIFGRVGLLLPLILLFLAGADSALACPGHSKVAYRTKAINTRASYIPTTVITYRAPASYKRCGPVMYNTRGAKYVAVRQNAGSAKYVAVRNDDRYIKLKQTRYVAVEAPRYVAIRHRYPVHSYGDGRYAEVRSGYRSGNGVVRYINVDDAPRYAVVRRAPAVRYVAVRNVDNGCVRRVALRSCLDQIETRSVSRVVVRKANPTNVRYVAARHVEDDDDDEYIALPRRTKYVAVHEDVDDDDDYIAVSDEFDDDAEYVAVQPRTKYVAIRDEIDDDDEYIALPRTKATYITYAPATSCESYSQSYSYIPEAVSTRSVSYVPVSYEDEDDLDDKAILDEDGATIVADDDIEDAYLSTVESEPVATTQAVSYVPAEAIEPDYAFEKLGESRYIVTGNAAPHSIPYVALDEDLVFDDVDPAFVEANAGEIVSGAVAAVPVEEVEAVEAEPVSYIPVEDVEEVDGDMVSYVPVSDVDEIDMETVTYVPARNMQRVSYVPVSDDDVASVRYVAVDGDDMETVAYVPDSTIDGVETTYISADECPVMVSSVDAEPVYVSGSSTVFVEDADTELVAALSTTQRIAGGFGYRDGFEDGQEAALEGDVYHPENSGDFEKATEGYEDEYGDKDVYKDAYRSSYLEGYRAGFASGNAV